MKITHIETIPIRVPIKPELAIRSGRGGSHSVSPFLLVRIHTDEGIIGLGEASCTPRWSGEDQVSAAHFINTYFAPLLVGETVDDVHHLNTKFCSAVAGNYFTKAALEMALWDILGKAQNKPVWEVLAGSREHGVAIVAPRSSPLTLRSAPCLRNGRYPAWSPLRRPRLPFGLEPQGFSRMKVKVGIDPQGDIERVRAVRTAVGSHVKLGVDANGGWSTPRVAIDTIQRLCDECDINFAEQPISAGDHDALAEVRRSVSIPIVADESVYTLADAKMLARVGAADVFSIYIGKAGGIEPAREIADFAHSQGIKCTVGSNLELGIGSAAMIHFALSAPGIDAETYPCDIIGPMFYEEDVLNEPLLITGGSGAAVTRPSRKPSGPQESKSTATTL